MCFLAQENYINLPGLLFSCKYKVTVHMLKSKRRSKDESTTFLTPSCATIRSKTHKHIPCPGEGGECSGGGRLQAIKWIHVGVNTVFHAIYKNSTVGAPTVPPPLVPLTSSTKFHTLIWHQSLNFPVLFCFHQNPLITSWDIGENVKKPL